MHAHNPSWGEIIPIAFLIAGNLLGAGILDSRLPKDREYWHLEHEKEILPSGSPLSGEMGS
jgi:hypothetical protein